MLSIDKGSAAAWSTRRLLETFWDVDVDGFEGAFDDAREYQATVLWNLVIVAGGTIDAIATATDQSLDDLLPSVWLQLAQDGDTEESALMRAMVTAWSSRATGDPAALIEQGALADANQVALVMNFAATTNILIHMLCEITTEEFTSATKRLWELLGTA